MKEIEQIKMRTDLKILTKDYGFNYHSLGEIFNCNEKVVRDFVNIKTRTLNDIHYQSIKKGLFRIQKQIKKAEEYKGFDYVDERIKSIQDNVLKHTHKYYISLRKTKDMTQKDVAEKTGLCLRTITGYECGEKVNDESNRLIESFYTHLDYHSYKKGQTFD